MLPLHHGANTQVTHTFNLTPTGNIEFPLHYTGTSVACGGGGDTGLGLKAGSGPMCKLGTFLLGG